jgi:hypothetical protein
MQNETNRADLEAGMRLLAQEYQENIVTAKARANFTAVEQLRLRSELAKEYQRNRAQERTAINAQLRDD